MSGIGRPLETELNQARRIVKIIDDGMVKNIVIKY